MKLFKKKKTTIKEPELSEFDLDVLHYMICYHGNLIYNAIENRRGLYSKTAIEDFKKIRDSINKISTKYNKAKVIGLADFHGLLDLHGF